MSGEALSNAMVTIDTRTDVALILWNPDVIDLVSLLLLERNLTSNGVEPSEGLERINDLMLYWRPSLAVFDLDPPYDRSAAGAMRLMQRFSEIAFVMTCADSRLAVKSVPWLSSQVMFEKPYAMDKLADTIRSTVRQSCRSWAAAPMGR